MNRQSQVAPRSAGGAAVALPASSYWRHIVPLALAMIAVIGARSHEGVPFVHLIRPALVLGLFGGILAYTQTSGEVVRRALANPVFRSVAIYFAWAAVTVPFAIWRGGAFVALRGVLPAAVLTFVCLLCPPTREVVLKLQRGFVLSCVGTGFGAMLFGYISDEGRLTTNGSLDANDLAAVMAMSMPLALGLLSRERQILRRLLWLGCAVVLGYVLMKAGSRGGLIAVVCSTLFFVIGQRGARRPIFFVLAIVGGLAAWSTGTKSFKAKVVGLIHGEEDYNYTDYSGRKQVWARARGYIKENPVLGVGIGNFPFAEGESCRKAMPDMGCKWSATHNSWLQAGAEMGIPGMLLFIAMLVRAARIGVKTWLPRRQPHGMHLPELFAALVGFATAATFLSHAYFYLLFALLGLIALAGVVVDAEMAAAAAGGMPVPVPGAPPAPMGRRPMGAPRPVAPRPGMPRPVGRPVRPVAPWAVPQPSGMPRRMGGQQP